MVEFMVAIFFPVREAAAAAVAVAVLAEGEVCS
jgi:hypothetical protein